MNPNTAMLEAPVGDDGLTDEERDILKTPVVQIAPDQHHILCALHEKRATYIYAENERLRKEEERKKHVGRFA